MVLLAILFDDSVSHVLVTVAGEDFNWEAIRILHESLEHIGLTALKDHNVVTDGSLLWIWLLFLRLCRVLFLLAFQLVLFCFEHFVKESVLSSFLVALENVWSSTSAKKFINCKAGGSNLENLLKESLICWTLFLFEVLVKQDLFK